MPGQKLNSVSRRSFIEKISKTAALGSLGLGALPAFAKAEEAPVAVPAAEHVFLTKPYLHTMRNDRMTIRCLTGKPSYTWIEFGEHNKLDRKAHAVTDGLVNAHNRIHEITLQGLQPGKAYRYRVAAKEITEFQPYKLTYGQTIYSEVYTFHAFNNSAEEVQWLVLNDMHDRPASFLHLMQLNKEEPYDYVFLNGDMFDYQTDEQQIIDHLLAPCTECFATQKPMLFVRGNHETRGKYARQLRDYFSAPQGQYFSFQHGPVFSIALDTGEDKVDAHPVYAGIVDFDTYRQQQAQWLEDQLQSKACKKAAFRVVMMHIPPHYSGDGHGTLHCRQLFSPLFDKYKVDLVIAGHTHTYGVHPPVKGKHNYPIVIGGGPRDGKRTLIKVNANRRQLALQMLGDDGAEVGRYVVSA